MSSTVGRPRLGVRPRVLAVMGPTASGKTTLAVGLAQELGAELVNGDSRQAIAELAIGVCKPTPGDLKGVACHGLDWAHLGGSFSVAEYRLLASSAVEEVAGRGRTAIVVGGTGLYIRALLAGFDFGAVAPNPERVASRPGLTRERVGAAALRAELQQLHSSGAATLDLQNPRRLARAVELARAGARAGRRAPRWRALKLGCWVSPPVLRSRIEQRSARLVGEPLREEVERLLAAGYSAELLSRSAIGYAEVVDWARGACEWDEAVERVVVRTRRYAKAQMTWLRSEPDLVWIDAGAGSAAIATLIRAVLAAANP